MRRLPVPSGSLVIPDIRANEDIDDRGMDEDGDNGGIGGETSEEEVGYAYEPCGLGKRLALTILFANAKRRIQRGRVGGAWKAGSTFRVFRLQLFWRT